MSPEQQQHCKNIQDAFDSALNAKYAIGQAEHGGNLWERPCLMELGNELVDAITYYHVIRSNITNIRAQIAFAREYLSKGDFVRLEETLDAIYQLAQ